MKTLNVVKSTSRFFARSFRHVPTNLISRTWGHIARTSASRYMIKPFARMFHIRSDEAELNIDEYQTLNSFFTRKLKPGIRPIDLDPHALICPVDGWVSAFGPCKEDQLLQAKGLNYTLFGILRDGHMARRFKNGCFVTLYLSPQDYHRVHAPLDLEITGLGYMPGTLFPVNNTSVRWIHGLYTQNERVMVYATSPAGCTAMVLIGAHCVGFINLGFYKLITNQIGRTPKKVNFGDPVKLKKADEVGLFEMGSTVVLLFEKDRVVLDMLEVGKSVRLGQRIGSIGKLSESR